MTHADVSSTQSSSPALGGDDTAALIAAGGAHLGIELGSTRIKAALVDGAGAVLATGSHAWENELVEETWTYSLDAVWAGIRECYADLAREVRTQHGTELTTLGGLGATTARRCHHRLSARLCLHRLATQIRCQSQLRLVRGVAHSRWTHRDGTSGNGPAHRLNLRGALGAVQTHAQSTHAGQSTSPVSTTRVTPSPASHKVSTTW